MYKEKEGKEDPQKVLENLFLDGLFAPFDGRLMMLLNVAPYKDLFYDFACAIVEVRKKFSIGLSEYAAAGDEFEGDESLRFSFGHALIIKLGQRIFKASERQTFGAWAQRIERFQVVCWKYLYAHFYINYVMPVPEKKRGGRKEKKAEKAQFQLQLMRMKILIDLLDPHDSYARLALEAASLSDQAYIKALVELRDVAILDCAIWNNIQPSLIELVVPGKAWPEGLKLVRDTIGAHSKLAVRACRFMAVCECCAGGYGAGTVALFSKEKMKKPERSDHKRHLPRLFVQNKEGNPSERSELEKCKYRKAK